MDTLSLTKEARIYNGVKTISFIRGAGKSGQLLETCILSCKKPIASLCSMQDTGCLGLVHGDDPERCYGEGSGRGVQDGNTCAPMVDSC